MIISDLPSLSFRAQTDSNVRSSGPRFRRLVFFSLLPAGPNLPMRGIVYDTAYNYLDRDLDSDEVEGSEVNDSDSGSVSCSYIHFSRCVLMRCT